MYIYHFSQYAGTDRVFHYDGEGDIGDVLDMGSGAYALCLGDDIAWKEQVGSRALWKTTGHTLVKQLLGPMTIHSLHMFTTTWFTTYKKSLPLWIHDIEDIVRRHTSIKRQQPSHMVRQRDQQQLIVDTEPKVGQQLVVFPDLWTLRQYIPYDITHESGICYLHSKSTKKQKSDAFWGIKSGHIHTLCCTYSQLFQDWLDLRSILLIDSHKRYYKSQQEPRYMTPTVVADIASCYGADVVTTGYSLSIDI